MKHVVTAIILFGFVEVALAQNPSHQRQVEKHFRWSQSNAHELEYGRTIRLSAELGPDEKASLIETIAAQIRPYMADLEIASERELRKIVARTRIKLIDLNNDGTDEILAQSIGIKTGCGATGNCPFWVFKKTPAGFRKLLDTRDKGGIGGIQLITINASRTNGFNDIVLGTHDSASERTLYVYRFAQKQYRAAECYNANWLSTEGGTFSLLKYPEIKDCK